MMPVSAMEFYDGWIMADHNIFTDFYDDDYKISGAIMFKGIRNTKGFFSNSFFDYQDGSEGNFVKGIPKYSFGSQNKERRGLVVDEDGTITGWPHSTIVPDRPFFTSTLCDSRPHWGNMSVCPHHYADLTDHGGYGGGNYVVSRDDVDPDLDICTAGGDSPCHYRLMGISADHSYIMAPVEYSGYLSATIGGIPDGKFLRIGICFPLNSLFYFDEKYGPVEMDSMDELMEDTTGNGYFVDREVGVVFRKFRGDGWSKTFTLVVYEEGSDDVNCIQRAYPKYQSK